MNQVEVAKEWCHGCKHGDPIGPEEEWGTNCVMHIGESNGGVAFQCMAGERDVLLNLIRDAEWAGKDWREKPACPWCEESRDDIYGMLTALHRRDCPARLVMGWRAT